MPGWSGTGSLDRQETVEERPIPPASLTKIFLRPPSLRSSSCRPVIAHLPSAIVGSRQLSEKRPVADHGLSQILGARLPSIGPRRYLAGSPVVIHHMGVVYGNIGHALLWGAHRISSRLHRFAHQMIRRRCRALRVVRKLRLDGLPRLG